MVVGLSITLGVRLPLLRLNISLYKILLDPPYRSWRLSGREQNETDSESNVSDAFRCEWSAEDVFSTLSTLDPEFCARKVSYLKQRLYKKDALSITDLGIDFSDLHPFYGSTRNFILPREGSNVSAEMKDCIPPYLIDDESNGEAEEVTEESLDEYLNVLCRHRLLDSVWRPLASMCRGFNRVVDTEELFPAMPSPPDRGRPLAALLRARELQWLVEGDITVDVADWKTHTVFSGGFTAESHVVLWFFELVDEDQNLAKSVLRFVTGSGSAPVGGFACLAGASGGLAPFRLNRLHPKHSQARSVAPMGGNVDGWLPQVHVCFNTMDLPDYSSKDVLEEKLRTAVLRISK
jgi:hypothetical protein